MITILHAADLHLDSPFSGLAPDQAAKRRGEQRLLLDDLTALAKDEGADVVLLSGDLFDSAHVYPQTIRSLARCLGEMPCPVFISPGNHDPFTDTSPYTTVEWPENVHIFRKNVEKYPLPGHNCVVYGFGFTDTHMTVSPLEGFLVNEGRDTVKLMCLHADLTPNSPYCPIDPGQIAASGLTYLALGHVHGHSGLQRSGSTYYAYPGCPQGRGFDETGEKGALILRAEPGNVTAKFVPLCRRRYEVLTVDVTGRDPLHAVLEALPPDTAPHTYRIVLSGECPGADVPALTAALEPRFAALTVLDRTRLPLDLWEKRGGDDLTGLVLDQLWARLMGDPDNETLRLAARFALAAMEGGEDPAP